MTDPSKIKLSHTQRAACVYVRQSTPGQVEYNRESTARQYALAERACQLGWPKEQVVIIDEDLGLSGSSSDKRSGFARLTSEVALAPVGIVLGLEVSRLARNNADWYRLLELCGVTDTLIGDNDGVYHPALFNDRLLLGLKGTMSEAELHIIRARLDGRFVTVCDLGGVCWDVPKMRAIFLCLAVCSCSVWAQVPAPADRKGCLESKVVTRMPGCVIIRCDSKDFSAAEMPRTKAERGHQVEGEFESTVYRCPSGKSPLELGRNTETALKNAGFNILYTDVYAGGARFWMTAQKGSQWVKLYVVSDAYELTAVKQKQMEQVMTANADGWAQQINQSGRVSVYGINFDTGKSTIRPDSEPALNELVKLLQTNTSWAMVVAGHTDNVGTQATNLALSRERAQSVISWLSVHGVAGARLVPAGFGDTRPIAENKDEEGRQKNRRVDLVKLY